MAAALTMQRGLRWGGWFLLLQAAALLAAAAWLLNLFGPATQAAAGRVVQVAELPAGYRGRVGYAVTVTFTPRGAQQAIAFTDPTTRSNAAAHPVGQSVTVRYRAASPQDARIDDSPWFARAMGLLAVVAALLLGLLAALLLRLGRPRPAGTAA
jgi:hypothetical protein